MEEELFPDEFRDQILETYPLPIAYEFSELMDFGTGDYWKCCTELNELLDAILRYCVLIVLNDYYLRNNEPNTDLEEEIVQRLIDPKIPDLLEILRRTMELYHGKTNQLFIPDFYHFVFQGEPRDGVHEETESIGLVHHIIGDFVSQLEDTEARGNILDDSTQQRELFERNLPRLRDILRALEFIKDYSLVQIVDVIPKDEASWIWRVERLMGVAREDNIEEWEMEQETTKGVVSVWNEKRGELLRLHPFALYRTAQTEDKEEDLFIYKRTKEEGVQYWGLKDTERGMPIQRVEPNAKDEIRIVLRVEAWPPGDEVVASEEEIANWRFIGRLAATQSISQLAEYEKEKYNPALYLQREVIEGELQEFLESDKKGFLIVGDSGTGKTNLLCDIVREKLEEERDIVLFYNSGKLEGLEERMLERKIGRQLGLDMNFRALLGELDSMRADGDKKFLLVLDAINEYEEPKELLDLIWFDILSQVPEGMYEWFKVVVTCRTEAWRQLGAKFKARGQFYRTEEKVGLELKKFSEEELPKAYRIYREKHKLEPAFDGLSMEAKRFIADPFMLKLASESFEGRKVPSDPKTSDVFAKYAEKKIGYEENPDMDRKERSFIKRLVELMYDAKTDELVEEELLEDEVIGDWAREYNNMKSPYYWLLEKGVLVRLQVETPRSRVIERAAAYTKVRFTYDRFFEYLLAATLIPREVTVERVRELSEEATRERYASLWGALKTRLVWYLEDEPIALTSRGILTELLEGETIQDEIQQKTSGEPEFWLWARVTGHAIQGLVVDTLVSYGSSRPDAVLNYISDVFLKSETESIGLTAVFAAYRLNIPEVFRVAYSHTNPIIRQIAIQHTYYYWARNREEAEAYLSELTEEAGREVRRGIPREALILGAGGEFTMERFPTLAAVLGTTFLIAGYLLSDPGATKQFATIFVNLFNSLGAAKTLIIPLMKRWVGNQMIEAWKAGGVINMDTLAIFTDRPLDDEMREEVCEIAPCMGSKPEPIRSIADKVFALGQEKDGVVSLEVVGILVNRSIHEPEDTLELLKRMFNDGNEISQYNVVRTMSSALQTNLDLCPGYLEFFFDALLDIWTENETTVQIEGRKYGLGHMSFGFTFECQLKQHGKLEFVDRLLALPWSGDKLERLRKVIDELGAVGILAFKMAEVKPYPVLDTLSQWIGGKNMDPEWKDEIDIALGRALARIWKAYPAEVEDYLQDEPELWMRMYETVRSEHFGGMANFGAQGMTSIVYMEPVLTGFIETFQKICREGADAGECVHMLASYVVDQATMERLAEWDYVVKS